MASDEIPELPSLPGKHVASKETRFHKLWYIKPTFSNCQRDPSHLANDQATVGITSKNQTKKIQKTYFTQKAMREMREAILLLEFFNAFNSLLMFSKGDSMLVCRLELPGKQSDNHTLADGGGKSTPKKTSTSHSDSTIPLHQKDPKRCKYCGNKG